MTHLASGSETGHQDPAFNTSVRREQVKTITVLYSVKEGQINILCHHALLLVLHKGISVMLYKLFQMLGIVCKKASLLLFSVTVNRYISVSWHAATSVLS
jgi:hypothetical protein